MPSTTAIVGSAIGLHARPADIISNRAADFDVEVLITFDGEEADAASSLEIMALGAEHGAEVTISSDDEAAMKVIADLVVQDLDAD
jgi:phosphocarrier protein HPr